MGDADGVLVGWKAIANELGVSVRTAIRYEKWGLPIYRIVPGSVRSRVNLVHQWERTRQGWLAIEMKEQEQDDGISAGV